MYLATPNSAKSRWCPWEIGYADGKKDPRSIVVIATSDGYRTQTLSSLEIQTLHGDVLLRIPLGKAVDIADAPRQNFYLTHRVTIPANLPPGSYVFHLRVDDMQSRESARGQVHVTVMADHSRPDETGGTSKFATRPDSFLR